MDLVSLVVNYRQLVLFYFAILTVNNERTNLGNRNNGELMPK